MQVADSQTIANLHFCLSTQSGNRTTLVSPSIIMSYKFKKDHSTICTSCNCYYHCTTNIQNIDLNTNRK
jgi:hypothetical protein